MLKSPICLILASILLTSGLLAATMSGCNPVSALQNQEPIEIVSVVGPLGPINPGGPGVKITLKNVGLEPVISLTATLDVSESYDFVFDVAPSNPLQPKKAPAPHWL